MVVVVVVVVVVDPALAVPNAWNHDGMPHICFADPSTPHRSYHMVLLAAAKFHAACQQLPQGVKPAFVSTTIRSALEWLFQLIVQRVRSAAKAEASQPQTSAAVTSSAPPSSLDSTLASAATTVSSPGTVTSPGQSSGPGSVAEHSYRPARGVSVCHCAVTHDQVPAAGCVVVGVACGSALNVDACVCDLCLCLTVAGQIIALGLDAFVVVLRTRTRQCPQYSRIISTLRGELKQPRFRAAWNAVASAALPCRHLVRHLKY